MNIFVINSGSSSVKYQLFRMPGGQVECIGLIDRIGLHDSTITHKFFLGGKEQIRKENLPIADHAAGLRIAARWLTDVTTGVIKDPDEIDVVGHRVVHGGERFSDTTIITLEVKEKIMELFPLAPLHNPPNYLGIEVAEKIFTKAKQVAVFDTAFHQTMPAMAYRMAIPAELYEQHAIRSYGFHGISHKYVSERAITYLQNQNSKIVTIHLGNGCSMSAVLNGKCIDTSMGLGPMNGLVMGTRAGDLDQSVIFHLANELAYEVNEINNILNKKSGMLGLTGHSDMRDVKAEYHKQSKEAILAYEMYAYRIRKYIGAYAAALNGLDAIVFTAGVGENDELTRELVCSNLDVLGIRLNNHRNTQSIKEITEIQAEDAKVKILVIPTNEELEIARQCYQLCTD